MRERVLVCMYLCVCVMAAVIGAAARMVAVAGAAARVIISRHARAIKP